MRVLPRNSTKQILLRSASTAAMVALASFATAAQAQLAPRRGATFTAPSIAPRAIPGAVRSVGATDALARQVATRTRAEQIRGFATQARAAVVRSVPDGMAGLVVARGVTREALAAGALQAVRDSTGRLTWQGAGLPVETTNGDTKLVVIDQTESRAILSWDRFDVGAKTTLQFNQKLGGIAQKDWVAVNRVVDPNAAPSQILGSIVADATVLVVNRNGMIFGNGAKVSANSLLASSLDIGNFFKAGSGVVVEPISGESSIKPGYVAATLQDRNLAFLQNGLFQGEGAPNTIAGTLVSAEASGFVEAPGNLGQLLANASPGAIEVERGASITAGKGGFVILTAPKLTNDGNLSAAEGQVSLQAGLAVTHTASTGAANGVDPNIRGIILRSTFDAAGSQVVNSGLIETQRGYASLGTSLKGSVVNSGLIAATTSVSRNGNISLTGGKITIEGNANPSQAGGLVILPDQNGETIPQGTAAAPANFKQSQITIGGVYLDVAASKTAPLGELGPASITLGANSLIHAPGATVKIGGQAGQAYSHLRFSAAEFPDAETALAASKIDIADGALIDVSGVKDVAVAASRNSLLIDPVKRNELRDTPNYREINTNGEFTLNGAAVYVDPRITGVRDDGVAYIGSPLIEAGSAASQIGISAAEFMTTGGTVDMAVAALDTATSPALAPRINVASGATIDLSGGWVTYADGIVRTSRLLTVDGRVIDIGQADPNDRFVAVGDGFNEVQAKFGISRIYANSILQGARFEAGYDEGRDAGALSFSAPTLNLDGTLYGQAFAGVRQLSDAKQPSRESKIAGDIRQLQSAASQLPSGASLYIGTYDRELAADIVVGSAGSAAPEGAIRLDAAKLSGVGLSALSLRTSAGVEFAAGSKLVLANGGALDVEAGRAIHFDGDVTAVSGSITARTIDFGKVNGVSGGSQGSPFRADDNLAGRYAQDPALSPFDITVKGKLSAAGLWTNDFTGTSFTGRGWVDGGSISLTVAPSSFAEIEGSNNAADLSGSIRIDPAALLDVSSGGYVSTGGAFDFGAKGGNVSLINETVYASRQLTDPDISNTATAGLPFGGANQTVTFKPYDVGQTNVTFARTVDTARSEVSFEVSSIKGFGFDGGGTFELVAPDIAMGSEPGSKGPRIGLDFIQRTGFGTLDLTVVKSRIVSNLFTNGIVGNSAFLDTERFVVGAGQTLDLTQVVLPQLLDTATRTALSGAETGTEVTSLLTPGIPADAWDRKAANLVLGGITELEVAEGGSIVGAAGASITIPRLYNAGTIRIAGGSIVQNDPFTTLLSTQRVVGVRDVAFGGGGLSDIFGGGVAGQVNGFDEKAMADVAVFRDLEQTQRVDNGQLFSFVDPAGSKRVTDVFAIFTGRAALNEGIHLTAGSTTDLSGIALYNPRAGFLASGRQQRTGRVVAGGAISTSFRGSAQTPSGYGSPIDPSNRLVAEAGARIALDGASGVYDERVSSTSIAAVTQWSDAGKLAIGSGALLTGAKISAFGGDDGDADVNKTKATGGLLDWVAPVIRQTDDGTTSDASTLFASQIMEAGFDSLVARNGFTTAGTVDFALDKSFIATTDSVDGTRSAGALVITAAPGSAASITAPYIRLLSSAKTIGQLPDMVGTGSLSLTAKAMDIVGSVTFQVGDSTKGETRGRVRLEAAGDIRLIGTAGIADSSTGLFTPGLTGQLVSNGDLLFKAGQVYATTGTGNLQQLLEDRRALKTPTPTPYVIASTNVAGIVRFERQDGAIPDTPLSAGSYLRILGANIIQNGVLRAPLGLLEIGANSPVPLAFPIIAPATVSLSFGQTSLTSVSARAGLTGTAALDIPYGTTTDLIEYFFNPGSTGVLTTMPVGELRLAGKDIVIADGGNGVRIDGRGGGDLFAYEFIPGTGGSRDILDRLNPDAFSGNNGLQYADGRQVYAILPKNAATAALFDPIYSADYAGGGGVDLYGADAGLTVHLDGAPGIPAGDYLLLPAHYALLPGAMRIVENVGAAAPFSGGATELLDGSMLVGGVYGTAGTELTQSQRRSFTVQSQDVIAKYSRIETTSGSETVEALAGHKGLATPPMPRDAARVVLSPLTSLKVAGAFSTDAAEGGLGSRVDIGGKKIRIGAQGATAEAATEDYLLLTTDTLANFKANSLSIGALRSENTNGTTTLDVIANTIFVDNDVKLSAPELLLAVGGPGALLQIEDAARNQPGAQLIATGVLADQRTGDYIVNATAPRDSATGEIDQTGAGALLRISTGPERLVSREGDFAVRNSTLPARLDIGAGTEIRGNSITLDSSRVFAIDRRAQIGAVQPDGQFTLALSSDLLRLGGVSFRPEIEAQFANASRLTLRSPDVVNFDPGIYEFNDLTIDAPGIGMGQPSAVQAIDVKIVADDVVLRNSSADRGACRDVISRACVTGNVLQFDASTITFGGGTFRTHGFYQKDDGKGGLLAAVTLAARNGMFVSGKGTFSTRSADEFVDASLSLVTPFIVDRTEQSLLGDYIRPDYEFATSGAMTITGPAAGAVVPAGGEAPGAHLAFSAGSAFSEGITIENTVIRATAGTIDITVPGSILLGGTASLQTPGFTKTFDDGVEQTVVSASGGVINLAVTEVGGVIDAASTTSLIVDNGIGKAGILNISAPENEVSLLSQLNPGIATNVDRSASFRFDTGFSEFDLSAFIATYGRRFQGDILVRSGLGDLSLLAGQAIKADSVRLIADGGKVLVAGTIDTSGDSVAGLALTDAAYRDARVDGGAISLFGREGVSLGGTAALISTTSGYNALDTRQASGGKVTIGIGIPEAPDAPAAAIDIASGAVINVAALRPGNRLVEKLVTDPITQLETTAYHMAAGDQGGLVNFRAPVLDDNSVNFANRGRIEGARELSIEGYRRFDLDAITQSGDFSGLSVRDINGFQYIVLDPAAGAAGKPNFLADIAPGTIPDFIRNFSITGPDGEALAGYRLRPGVELSSAMGIQLQSDWNLGAGTIDIEAVLEKNPELLVPSTLGTFKDGQLAGTTAYEVAYGAEAESELFNNYVDMLYRVDGSVSGEAPVISFRAAEDLNIRSSITDGFFTFHDKTNSDYINYELGGGDRTYNPALNVNCGADGTCEESLKLDEVPPGIIAGGAIGSRITIQIGAAQQGTENSPFFIQAPYNPLANAASPSGTGDALGVAELFPLLADGSAVHSSSLQLVGGALTGSANPLQVGAASPFLTADVPGQGSVVVSGEKSFEIAPTSGATARLDGTFQLAFGTVAAGDRQFYSMPELLALIDSGETAGLDADFYTVLNWGAGTTGASGEARARAKAYSAFAADRFLGPKNSPTGVAARLRDVVAFLAESGFGDTFAEGVSEGKPGYTSAPVLQAPITKLQRPTTYVGTKVRTGDGSIDIAAANNIDLRRSPGIVYRRNPGENSDASDMAQVGGTAVYTAGVRAAASDLAGAVLPDAGVPKLGYVPGPTSGVAVAPVFAKDGGSITLTAGQDVLGRRDIWSERFGENGSALLLSNQPIVLARGYPVNTSVTAPNYSMFGSNSADQRWRFGKTSSTETMASIAFNYFTSGVGALSGGDVSIRAGRDVSELTVALTNSLVTGRVDGVQTLVSLGSGNLSLAAGRNLLGGQFDIASGFAMAQIGGNVSSAGTILRSSTALIDDNLLRVRIADATFGLTSKGSVTVGGLGALGVSGGLNQSLGFFSSLAGVSIDAIEDIELIGNSRDQFVVSDGVPGIEGNNPVGYVLPPSLSLVTIGGDIDFSDPVRVGQTELRRPRVTYGTEFGQLTLLSGGNIGNLALAMGDAAPTNMFGAPSVQSILFPSFLSTTADSVLRVQHDRRILHRDDLEPARIVAEGSITDVVLSLPKASRIRAGQDIVDLFFQGQNVRATDVTRISAGRDITATVGVSTGPGTAGRSAVRGNNIVLGGPGALFVEAGRDLGPFITSATGAARTEAGGIRTIGNEANPWLAPQGADLYVMFGVGQGADYAALESTYLDPANLGQLDGDLFEANEDAFGNKTPDRSRYSYAPVLAEWLRDNHPDAFAAVFGDANPSGDALKQQSYARYDDLYQAFASLDQLGRSRFLIDKLYFGELQAPSDPNSASFNQFVRGYRAVQTLFSPERGYTDNLATYVTDPATINADHPLGVPTKRLVNGEPAVADVKQTGNVDLRLSTLQTARGGNVTILGPGGNFVAGSVVRTDAQIQRRISALNITREFEVDDLQAGNYLAGLGDNGRITAIPTGYEGILTLRGGEVRGFTDGSFVLNQSRLFTQAGGDITLWSSNGDLNAGQGPRSSSNFPPIVLRFSPNGSSEVNSAGSVSGAGIGAFKSSPDDPEASIHLIAPVGTVDAGDAGVRASGSIFVAAARVANADNFAAGGTLSGVPSGVAQAAPPVPASAASAIVANAFRAATAVGDGADRLSRIFVDVLGYLGSDRQDCPEGQSPDADGQCKVDSAR